MSRHNGGWFKVWREAWEKDLSRNVYLWALWHSLLHMAHWKESKIVWEGNQRTLPPGSVIFGIKELADKWGCSRSVIKKWLHYLNDTGRIVLDTCPRGCLATICNWEIYQGSEDASCPDRDHNVSATSPQRDNNAPLSEEGKKERSNTRRLPLEYTKEFDDLYNQYPRKEGKQTGFKTYLKSIKSDQDRERLSLAIRNYAEKCRKEGREPRYIKQFSSFMNNWTDYLEPLNANSGEDEWKAI